MNLFRMSMTEKDVLAELGKLHLFAYRVKRTGLPLTEELQVEYHDILRAYHKEKVDHVYRQIVRLIGSIQKRLSFDMKSLDRHFPVTADVKHGRIISVLCACGEFTKYRVPLKLLDEFQCPKEQRDEIDRPRTRNRA